MYIVNISKGYLNLTIVHLEMLNVLVAIRIFGLYWHRRKVQIKRDNIAVVQILTYYRTKDMFWLHVREMFGVRLLYMMWNSHIFI